MNFILSHLPNVAQVLTFLVFWLGFICGWISANKIGYYIARKIVEKHNAAIFIASKDYGKILGDK